MFDETGKTANRIIDSAIHDPGGDGAQERHERRMRAMRSLGDAERRSDNILKVGMWSSVAMLVAIVLLPVLIYIHSGPPNGNVHQIDATQSRGTAR